jgi:hypothetical protein
MQIEMNVTYGQGFLPTLPMFANMGLTKIDVTPDKIVKLQDELLKMEQADIVTEHTFKILTAPCEFDAKAGAQRVGRVFEDEVVWVDIYANSDDCKDIAVLEDRLYVVPVYGLGDSRTAEQQAQIDYLLFLKQIGMTREQVHAIAENESDLIDMPEGHFVELRDSQIHGKGLFATKSFEIGEIICPGRLNGKRTPGGRFINHSFNANIEPVKNGDDIYAVATKDIKIDDELLVDYRTSMKINFGIVLQGELT